MSTGSITHLADGLPIPPEGIASRPLLDLKDATKLVLFALDAGQEISPHQTPFPAAVLLLAGAIRVLVGETWHTLRPSETIELPLGLPHAIQAAAPSHFLLTMHRDVREPGGRADHDGGASRPPCPCAVHA